MAGKNLKWPVLQLVLFLSSETDQKMAVAWTTAMSRNSRSRKATTHLMTSKKGSSAAAVETNNNKKTLIMPHNNVIEPDAVFADQDMIEQVDELAEEMESLDERNYFRHTVQPEEKEVPEVLLDEDLDLTIEATRVEPAKGFGQGINENNDNKGHQKESKRNCQKNSGDDNDTNLSAQESERVKHQIRTASEAIEKANSIGIEAPDKQADTKNKNAGPVVANQNKKSFLRSFAKGAKIGATKAFQVTVQGAKPMVKLPIS